MHALFLHEIRLPVAKLHRYIKIRSHACRMANGDPRCRGEEETCVPGGEVTRRGWKPWHSRDCNSNNNSPLPRDLLPYFRDSGFCFSFRSLQIQMQSWLRIVLGSCDVYDLTASHLSCSFQFITECFNSCYKTLCLKLY